MNRIDKKNIFVTILLLIFCIPGFPGKPDLKNIIIIAVDTLRADHIGCYGYPINTTPAIDRFAKDGTIFKRAYAPTPLTGPSFATMLTSLPPYKHGAKRNGLPIYKHIKTLAWYLKKFGYNTAAFISNYFLKRKLTDLHKGFDSYFEVFNRKRWMGVFTSEGSADEVNQQAVNWLEKYHKKRFFLWVHYTEPHAPYNLHKNFKLHGKEVDKSLYPPGTRYSKIKKYDSEIAFDDFHIGKIIEKITSLGLYKDALIIFVSDHGESFGEHNYFRHGRKLYNSTLHVALIVKLPGNRLNNSVRHDNVTLMDVSPTILSLLKLPIPAQMEGSPLFKEGKNKSGEIHVETYKGAVIFKKKQKAHLEVRPIKYGIVKDSMKLIYDTKTEKFEAYNLEIDRFETENLLNPTGLKFPILKKMLSKYMVNVEDYIKHTSKRFKRKSRLSREDIEQLKSLGYID